MRQVGLMSEMGCHKRHKRMMRACMLGVAVSLAVSLGACTTVGSGGSGPTSEAALAEAAKLAAERALWASGVEAEGAHNYEGAIGAFSNLYERTPDDVEVLKALIRNMRYAGRAADAVGFVERRARHLLEDVGVKFEYAKAQLAAGRKVNALNTLRAVATLMPDQWQVHSAMGIAYDSIGQFDKAIAAYENALRLSPENAIIMNNLAMSQAMAGQLQAAIQTLEAAALVNRANTHVRQNLALLYAANGENAKARALAAMDLDSGDLETNLSFYRRFGGKLP